MTRIITTVRRSVCVNLELFTSLRLRSEVSSRLVNQHKLCLLTQQPVICMSKDYLTIRQTHSADRRHNSEVEAASRRRPKKFSAIVDFTKILLIKRLGKVGALVLRQGWVSDGPRPAGGPSTHFNRPATCTANGP